MHQVSLDIETFDQAVEDYLSRGDDIFRRKFAKRPKETQQQIIKAMYGVEIKLTDHFILQN